MCYIMLNDKVRINCSDMRNYVPEILRTNEEKGNTYWKGYGYFSSLKLAVDKIIDLKLFPENTNLSLKQFIDNFQRSKEELTNSMLEKVERELNS